MTYWLLLLRSVRHTRIRQLVSRLLLTLKRNALVGLTLVWPALSHRNRSPNADVRLDVPSAILPTRAGIARTTEDEYALTFLNRTHYFRHPFDWHRPALNRGTRLWKLNLHYMEFLAELDDARFVRVVDDWIQANRPYDRGYWLDSWNSYALSIRCVVWMQEYARRKTNLSPSFQQVLLGSLREQLSFLLNNLETDIGGNHLLRNCRALLWGAAFFSGAFADRLEKVGKRVLRQELQTQMLPDGFHFELSPTYHCQVFGDLLESCLVLPDGDLKDALQLTLARAAVVIAGTTHPDGRCSLFNDGGLEISHPPEVLLKSWQAIGGAAPSLGRDISFPYAGYFGRREQLQFVLCDLGRVGPDSLPAHAHGDIFSFEWSLGTQRIVVDAGVFEYDPGPRRSYSRSTRAHNTVTLNDLDQCEFWASFRMGRRANVSKVLAVVDDRTSIFEGWHDGYAHLPGKPIHHRRFEIALGRIHVVDTIEQGSGQRVSARLLFHPLAQIHVVDSNVAIIRIADIAVRLSCSGAIAVERGDWYPAFGVIHDAMRVVMTYGNAPCEGSFTLARTSPGQ